MTTKLEAPAQEPRNVDGGGTASLAGVSRAFGSVRALEGVDLEVGAGEIVAVVGPSGCGKTTLLELVCGLQAPDAGRVRADPAVLMPQRDNLLPWLRAIDNAALALRLGGASRAEARARAHPLFAAFGLEGFERARPHELSGGMRQRVAFLRTLLSGKPRAVPRRAVRRARRADAARDAGLARAGARPGAAHGAARDPRRRGGRPCWATASSSSRPGPGAWWPQLAVPRPRSEADVARACASGRWRRCAA